eukprot:3857782-Prorocentrum_lima.AAC.1
MTSSLVGSEMCIRDRQSRTKCERCGWTRTTMGNDTNRGGQSFESLPRTVSYTHLTLPTICSV